MFTGLDYKISILIKTFNRKGSLLRLLTSLEKLNCTLSILIADDSQLPCREEILSRFSKLKIDYYNLPFDSGLSEGRNFLLHKVTTPYFLLCDDDFMFSKVTQLTKAFTGVEENNLDIGGGTFLNFTTVNSIRKLIKLCIRPTLLYQFIRKASTASAYIGNFMVEQNSCILFISHSFKPDEEVFICDVVNNFFIGNTVSIKKIGGWDNSLKVGEHEDFFYRAKLAGLKTAFLKDFSINHYPIANKDYLPFRERSVQMKQEFIIKSGFTFYKEINTDSGDTIFEYKVEKQAIEAE